MVAESIVILAPMVQRGCFKACSFVTARICSFVKPRNGPPDAVSRMRRMRLSALPCRHWKMAECSLSTGRKLTPVFFTASMIRLPPATSVSLFANAISLPARTASYVGRMPIIPSSAFTTICASVETAASRIPSGPYRKRVPGNSADSFCASSFCAQTARAGLNSLSCSLNNSILRPQVRELTENSER